MKKRWIGGPALVAALVLGACAPTQQGAEESAEASGATQSSAPAMTAEPTESAEPMASESAAPTPDNYEY